MNYYLIGLIVLFGILGMYLYNTLKPKTKIHIKDISIKKEDNNETLNRDLSKIKDTF